MTIESLMFDWEKLPQSARTAYLDYCNENKDGAFAFDTETCQLPNSLESRVYVWQFHAEGNYMIYGRHLESFLDVINGLTKRQIIWVHNLSFDACYLWNIITPARDKNEDVRATIRGSHRFQNITCENGVQFKCSLIMYGTSLRTFLEQMNIPEEFRKTDYDYDGKYRDSETPLSREELTYCRNDVVGLTMAIRALSDDTGYEIRKLPGTSTGFIRRDMKAALGIKTAKLNPLARWCNSGHILTGLIKSFRGGNTHCNRWNMGRVLPCHSFDITSSYPASMVTENYPLKFYPAKRSTVKEFRDLARRGVVHDDRIAHLYHVIYYDIECGYLVPVPYISAATLECNGMDVEWYENVPDAFQYDNGRILQCRKAEMWINEIDAAIIESQYTYRTVRIVEEYTAQYAPLPEPMRQVMIKYFMDKCQIQPDTPAYHGSKRKLNAGYGMLAMNPYRESCVWNPQGGEDAFSSKLELTDQTFPYQWGCWVTSWSRAKLQAAIDCIEPMNFYYCDTDSVKFTGAIPEKLTRLIEELQNRARDYGVAIKNVKGKIKYLGAFDYEGCHNLKSLGAKKYMTDAPYEDENGDIVSQYTLTLAGANKKTGSMMMTSFEDFNDGLYIPNKLCPTYFDTGYHSVTLVDVGYHLSTTADYKTLCEGMQSQIIDELEGVYNAEE